MSDFGTIVDGEAVRFERLLPGPIERVWERLTTPGGLAAWLGRGTLELRVGGRIALDDLGGCGSSMAGVITRCEPPHRLSFTWIVPAPDGAPPFPSSEVAIELVALGDRVRLILVHRPVLQDFLARTGAGWHVLLDRLAAALRDALPTRFMDAFGPRLADYETRDGLMGRITEPGTVRFERLLPAPIEHVWQRLATADGLAAWLAEASLEPRAGASIELRFDADEMPERRQRGALVRGTITDYAPPRLIAYGWSVVAPDPQAPPIPNSHVTFELAPRGDRTLLVLTHRRVDRALCALVGAGWHTHLATLTAGLRSLPPEPFAAAFERVRSLYQAAFAPARWRSDGVRVVRGAALAGAGVGRATAFDFTGAGGRQTWIGRVSVAPRANTGAHHHGRHEVAVYVVAGRSEIRWGERLEYGAEIGPGDLAYFAPYVPHQERNLSASDTLDFLVVRSDDETIAVALETAPVDHPETVY